MNGWAGFWLALGLYLVFCDPGSALKIYVDKVVADVPKIEVK